MVGPLMMGLTGLALLGTPDPPEALLRLPADVRERATVVVSGTYRVDTGVGQPLPNAGSRSPLLQGFVTKTVYRGRVLAPYIGVEHAYPPRTWVDGLKLVEGQDYLLVLRPSERSERILGSREWSWSWWDVLPKDDILAIVAL